MIHIIDDEPTIREVLSSFIEYFGFANKTFKSAEVFLEHLQEESFEPPCMVFSDIRMSGISGLEMVQQFQLIYPDVPCCIVTAFDDQLTPDHPIYHKLHRIISKPFMLERIQDALEILEP